MQRECWGFGMVSGWSKDRTVRVKVGEEDESKVKGR